MDEKGGVATRRDARVPDSRSLYLDCPGPGPFLVGNRWKRREKERYPVLGDSKADVCPRVTLTDFRKSPLEAHGILNDNDLLNSVP